MKIRIHRNSFEAPDLRLRYKDVGPREINISELADVTEVRFTMEDCLVDAGAFSLVHNRGRQRGHHDPQRTPTGDGDPARPWAAVSVEEWAAIKVGDVLIDRYFRNALRKVYSVSRVAGKRGQRGLTRTCLTVTSLKGGGRTHVFESENTGPARFEVQR